jgi:Rrf2 family transcriptional regulator, iron-sulfur cluster assembly transcription factor
MKLSTRSRYGIRAVFDMAYHSQGQPMQIRDISERQGLTPRYLEQIFQRLKKAGLVRSIRGPRGGYYLTRPPEKISVSEVIRAAGEKMEPVFCVASDPGREKCPRESVCVARLIWGEARVAIENYLGSITVAQMCALAQNRGLEKVSKKGRAPKGRRSGRVKK